MRRTRVEARLDRMRGVQGVPTSLDDPVEALIARARKQRGKGDVRRTLVLLRQACALDEWRPRSFTLLGVHLAREGMVDEAIRAFRQARWLRIRAGEKARAAVTERLAAQLLSMAA